MRCDTGTTKICETSRQAQMLIKDRNEIYDIGQARVFAAQVEARVFADNSRQTCVFVTTRDKLCVLHWQLRRQTCVFWQLETSSRIYDNSGLSVIMTLETSSRIYHTSRTKQFMPLIRTSSKIYMSPQDKLEDLGTQDKLCYDNSETASFWTPQWLFIYDTSDARRFSMAGTTQYEKMKICNTSRQAQPHEQRQARRFVTSRQTQDLWRLRTSSAYSWQLKTSSQRI
jgi:hypothetical protein